MLWVLVRTHRYVTVERGQTGAGSNGQQGTGGAYDVLFVAVPFPGRVEKDHLNEEPDTAVETKRVGKFHGYLGFQGKHTVVGFLDTGDAGDIVDVDWYGVVGLKGVPFTVTVLFPELSSISGCTIQLLDIDKSTTHFTKSSGAAASERTFTPTSTGRFAIKLSDRVAKSGSTNVHSLYVLRVVSDTSNVAGLVGPLASMGSNLAGDVPGHKVPMVLTATDNVAGEGWIGAAVSGFAEGSDAPWGGLVQHIAGGGGNVGFFQLPAQSGDMVFVTADRVLGSEAELGFAIHGTEMVPGRVCPKVWGVTGHNPYYSELPSPYNHDYVICGVELKLTNGCKPPWTLKVSAPAPSAHTRTRKAFGGARGEGGNVQSPVVPVHKPCALLVCRSCVWRGTSALNCPHFLALPVCAGCDLVRCTARISKKAGHTR